MKEDLAVLLTIDDDSFFRAQVRQYAQSAFTVVECSSAAEAGVDILAGAAVVVLDLNMPDIDGVSFIRTLATLEPQPVVIIASGYDRKIIELAQKTAALSGLKKTAILQKPVSKHDFDAALERTRQIKMAGDKPNANPAFQCSLYDIRVGMTANEFVPYFQPQFDLASGTLVGFEVLIRWRHPALGLIPPGQFIELLEVSPLALRFTLMVAELALREFENLGIDPALHCTLSINIPPAVLAESDFPDALDTLLQQYRFPTSRLICEITERGLEDERSASSAASMARLRMKGFQLAIDDFGVGQSGLSKLKSMAFDEIKLDREFVAAMATGAESMAIVKSIHQLAVEMGLRVVMEGIEDMATLKAASGFDGIIAQGYLLGRPLPAAEVQTFLSLSATTRGNNGAITARG